MAYGDRCDSRTSSPMARLTIVEANGKSFRLLRPRVNFPVTSVFNTREESGARKGARPLSPPQAQVAPSARCRVASVRSLLPPLLRILQELPELVVFRGDTCPTLGGGVPAIIVDRHVD